MTQNILLGYILIGFVHATVHLSVSKLIYHNNIETALQHNNNDYYASYLNITNWNL